MPLSATGSISKPRKEPVINSGLIANNTGYRTFSAPRGAVTFTSNTLNTGN